MRPIGATLPALFSGNTYGTSEFRREIDNASSDSERNRPFPGGPFPRRQLAACKREAGTPVCRRQYQLISRYDYGNAPHCQLSR